MSTIRIGSGAGYSGDRIEPAVELAEHGGLDYLGFECLAERTIALAQGEKLRDPAAGFDPLLEARMEAVLRPCARERHPHHHQHGRGEPARRREGDSGDRAALGPRRPSRRRGHGGRRAGRGARGRLRALGAARHRRFARRQHPLGERLSRASRRSSRRCGGGADVVITGRVGDPALFLAPLVHEFGWAMDDWDRLGKARSSAICWNAPARSPAATSPTPATRTSPILPGSVFRSPR